MLDHVVESTLKSLEDVWYERAFILSRMINNRWAKCRVSPLLLPEIARDSQEYPIQKDTIARSTICRDCRLQCIRSHWKMKKKEREVLVQPSFHEAKFLLPILSYFWPFKYLVQVFSQESEGEAESDSPIDMKFPSLFTKLNIVLDPFKTQCYCRLCHLQT